MKHGLKVPLKCQHLYLDVLSVVLFTILVHQLIKAGRAEVQIHMHPSEIPADLQ